MTAAWTNGAATATPEEGEGRSRTRPLMAALGGLTVIVVPLLIFLAVGLATTPWVRAYQVGGAEAYLVAAALAPVVIATVFAERLGQPPAVSYGASLLGLVILALVLGGGDPASAWHGLSRDPTRLLTETLPLAGSAELLTAPAVLTWICGAATCELWVRSRANAFALAVPVALFVAANAATSAAPGNDSAAAPLLLAVLSLAAVIRHRQVEAARGVVDVSPDGRSETGVTTRVGTYTPGWRAASIGAALAVLVAAVLGVGVPALPGLGNHPTSLARSTPKTAGLLLDPVDAIASLRDSRPPSAAQTQFTVATDRAAPGYFGVATMDDYNGGSWTFDTTFHPSGGRIPPAPPGTPGAVTDTSSPAVSEQFRFDRSYQLPFVPTLDRPVQVRGLTVGADRQTGMILPAEAGSVPAAFTAFSRTPAATLEAVPSVDGIGTVAGTLEPVQVADTTIPTGTASDIAAAVRFLATLTGERPAPSLAFLQAVDQALASKERRIDTSGRAARQDTPTATGGTSLAEVINAVAVVKAATPEQFATFFVMVARYLGVPARLVTGFRVPAKGAGPGILTAGQHVVTNTDAWTWAEVPVAGVGWVVADPTPAATTTAATPPAEHVQATPTTVPSHQANAVPEKRILGGHAVAKPVQLTAPRHAHRSALSYLLLGLAALAVVILLAGPGQAALRRMARRRARRSPDPTAQTVGAWLEVLDGLHRSGMPTPHGATTAEVATSAGQHFGQNVVAPIEEIGALADRALFSLSDPPDAPSAARAWQLTGEVRHEVAVTLDRRQRARALLGVGDAPRRPVGTGR